MTSESFKALQETISACLVSTTRTAGHIAAEDLAFLRSSDPSVARQLDKQNARLLRIAGNLTRSAAAGTEVAAPELPDAEAVEDNWQGIVDVIDNLLEKADACLDEYTGVIKRLSPAQRSTPVPAAPRKALNARDYRNQDIAKPQLLFTNRPNNRDSTAFKPLLRTKPHAILPLEQSIHPLISEDRLTQYRHPYETEIVQSRYPNAAYVRADPVPYLPFESTTATFVDTPEAVQAMLAELKKATEIAIDLEHHDTHSYIGLVSLMQISTREKDWVVDTLKPWREELSVLNEVFADPIIIKVFHGAFMDMMWLQRDLGLYVVGLFDTYHASRALGYPRHSLASLLAKFANFDAQKQYQMADWRIRPLPAEMFDYARSDTHFLLNVYDNMRNELIDKSNASPDEVNLVDVVLEESKKEALQKYERPIYDRERGTGSNGWYNMLLRTPALFTKEQFAIFRAVHQWRDELARRYDESVNFIMQKSIIYNIAREMPADMAALLGCSHPISAPVRRHIGELLGVVRLAEAEGSSGPDVKEFMKAHTAGTEVFSSPHNFGKPQDFAKSSVLRPVSSFSVGPMVASIKSHVSSFWGRTVDDHGGGSISAQLSLPSLQDIRLALPLPPLTAEIFTDSNVEEDGASARLSQEPGSRVEHQYVKDRPAVNDDVFVIKELGGMRKRKATEVEEARKSVLGNDGVEQELAANGEDKERDISTNGASSELSALEKAELKSARKAQKKLEKAQRKKEEVESQARGVDPDGDPEEPFDYASAPSVLHAKPDKTDQSGRKKAFDPYSKSLNAPKGMRRSQKEIAGKSFTYRS